MMEQYTTSASTVLAVAPISIFNSSRQWTSSSGKSDGWGTAICVSSTYPTPSAQTTHTSSSKSSAAAERALANGTLSTFLTSASSPVATEIILPTNISSRIAPFAIATCTYTSTSTIPAHNPSNWTFATLSTIATHTTTAPYTTSSSSPINPESTSSLLSPISTSYILIQYLNSTSILSLLTSPISQSHCSSFTISPTSPTSPPHYPPSTTPPLLPHNPTTNPYTNFHNLLHTPPR
ncbi:hypothetical protein EAF04_010464 [Stromatinia cepivora]|nr:hypothetical protein EAF04_010464 [Stromatinia cepivora]